MGGERYVRKIKIQLILTCWVGLLTEFWPCSMYILIEKGTTFQLKSIPLIEVKPVALRTQKQRKTDDKHGYQTRDYQTIFSGVR
jgi:hypothetical protein